MGLNSKRFFHGFSFADLNFINFSILLQAYFLENRSADARYANSLVFSNFQLVLFSTLQLQFTGIWPILLRSTSLSALSAALQARFPRGFPLLADGLEEKSELQVF